MLKILLACYAEKPRSLIMLKTILASKTKNAKMQK